MKTRRPVSVLIVDRSAFVREALRWALEEMVGVRVIGETDNGLVALELVARQRPDLVVLDTTLTDGDGLALGRRLKEQPQPLTIIFLTSATEPAMVPPCMLAGDDAVTSKGAGRRGLLPVVRRAIRRLRQRAAD